MIAGTLDYGFILLCILLHPSTLLIFAPSNRYNIPIFQINQITGCHEKIVIYEILRFILLRLNTASQLHTQGHFQRRDVSQSVNTFIIY